MLFEYRELPIRANIYLNICNIGSLNVDHLATYDIVLLTVSRMV